MCPGGPPSLHTDWVAGAWSLTHFFSHFYQVGSADPTFSNSQTTKPPRLSEFGFSLASTASVVPRVQLLVSASYHWIDLIQHSLSDAFTKAVGAESQSEIKVNSDQKIDTSSHSKDSADHTTATTDKGPGGDAEAPKPDKKKKEKKKPKPVDTPITPNMVDLRVGHIIKAIKHPDADSLYVSTIDMGDETGPRTVCSGLVNHIPLEEMQDRLVVVVANLKPVKMRGIKSAAMVLCAANDTSVEFVNPPEGSQPGERLFFETYNTSEPEPVLSPKRKIWETLQPGFTTNEQREVVFRKNGDEERKLVNKDGARCLTSSLANVPVR